MTKFLFAIVSAVFGAVHVMSVTRKGPRDWRLILMWISWAATTAVAVGTIVKEANDGDDELEF